MAEKETIVVGVDGSSSARVALAWAFKEASLRGATLHVVHAWDFPMIAVGDFGPAALPVIAPADLEQVGKEVLHEAVASLPSESGAVEVVGSLLRGHPAEVLVEAARGADLLVVGSRGRGGFTGMLLGSVSAHVVHHATCPVVVVRAKPE